MKNKKLLRSTILLIFVSGVFVASCRNGNEEADAYGNFEADEVIVSARSQGELLSFDIREGQTVKAGQLIGRIDSTDAAIKKRQLQAQYSVIGARLKNLEAQLSVQDDQRNNLVREVNRMEKLLGEKAATGQQFDDVKGKLKVHDSQTGALRSQKNIILGEQAVLGAQIAEADNMISKSRVVSPLGGAILEKYADAGELVTPGKALLKIADMSEMELKVYISGSQLSSVVIGDSATILIDGRDDQMKTLKGVISWVSSQVEFTPKIIQTREERVNMVYAVKVRVRNDGTLKVGMPGEVRFSKE